MPRSTVFALVAKHGKQRAWFTGKGIDSEARKARRFKSAAIATVVAQRVAGRLPRGWKLYVTYAPRRPKPKRRRAKNPRKRVARVVRRRTRRSRRGRNPVRPLSAARRQVADARALFSRFTGHKADGVRNINFKVPQAATAFGVLDYVGYTTVRDGKREEYEHDFQRDPQHRPALAASPDGKQLLIVGGNYKFGHRGIENVHEAR